MRFKKNWLEIPFKGDTVITFIKTSNCENLVLYFSEKVQKIAAIAMLFGFQWPNNRLKMVLATPNDQEYPRYPLVLKFNVTLARSLRLVILYFLKWKFLFDDRRLYLHDIKWNSRSDVDGLDHTKRLLNLLCIVYIRWWFWTLRVRDRTRSSVGKLNITLSPVFLRSTSPF